LPGCFARDQLTSLSNKAQQIIILSGSPLCQNPRVQKEAVTLKAAGYKITVLGAWLTSAVKDQELELIDRLQIDYHPVLDWTQPDRAGQLRRFLSRLRMKVGSISHSTIGQESSWQIGYATSAMSKAARRLPADLFIAHSEAGLFVASQLLDRGNRIGIDMEDWFSEDLLPEARRKRPTKIVRALEEKLLRRASHVTCPSVAMSKALAIEFGCETPVVIYNAFPWRDRQQLDDLKRDRSRSEALSIHWYSQTLGPGRGLEDLFRALPFVRMKLELHLRGSLLPAGEQWLRGQIPNDWRSRVFVHPTVPDAELLSRISEHDIGFAGEMKYCRSRDLTVTNKMLHYLLAGLAVIASDTTGQREIALQAPDAIAIFQSGQVRQLAELINQFAERPENLAWAKAAALRAAEQKFCWEQTAPTLVRSVEHALLKK
jgi:glycosyltransferase involved in cell wall biosynthesis